MPEQTTSAGVEEGIRYHYDLPPQFFQLFLDKATMSYSCALFKDGNDGLDEAQGRKLRLVSRKLQLSYSDRLLDIGMGWGNMALYAAELGCQVTGVTLAPEQARYVKEQAAQRGLSDKLTVMVQDAAKLPFPDKSFDKVVTIGTSEHFPDLARVFREVRRVITDDGLFLQHAITCADEPGVQSVEGDFMKKHIFPVGELKTLGAYLRAFEEAQFEVIDVHDMTDNYPLTLYHWLRNLESAGESAVVELGVSVDRYRAQRLFLAGCVVAFAESHCFLYQELLRPTAPGRYRKTLPAGRHWLDLDDGARGTLPAPVLANPLVSLEIADAGSCFVEGAGGSLQLGEPVRPPDCRITIPADLMARAASRGGMALLDAYLNGEVDITGNLVAAAQVGSALLKLAL